MAVSVFDLFKIGIGPSSSHTVGPMRAALMFVRALERCEMLPFVARVRAELYGSLGATGKGHGTDKGVILGLLGEAPDTIDADTIEPRLLEVTASGQLALAGHHDVPFNARRDVAFYRQALPEHPNGLRLLAYREDGSIVRESTYLSVGGGFVVTAGADNSRMLDAPLQLPYRFSSGKELLNLCRENELSIAELMMQNELVWRTEAEIVEGLRRIWGLCKHVWTAAAGTKATSRVHWGSKRRAKALHQQLLRKDGGGDQSLAAMDWLNLFALAVNEENASGGRVVTAPTNGAAGIIPAVMHYYMKFIGMANEEGIFAFLLTSAAIGTLYKLNASISGAEVGCQGEVGVACSMAAGGLCAAMGGTPEQVEHAAEIGMEHNLGLTCDPVGVWCKSRASRETRWVQSKPSTQRAWR